MPNRPVYEVRPNPHNPELCDLYADGELLTASIGGSERGWLEELVKRFNAVEVRDAND